jgi:HNH endonuclease
MVLYLRSYGRCEFCGDQLRGSDSVAVHHRKLRSQGGNHELVNLALVHTSEHEWAHAHPAVSYELGWMVRGSSDPAEVPVVLGKPWL